MAYHGSKKGGDGVKTNKHTTPNAIICMNAIIDHMWGVHRGLKQQLRTVNSTHKNIPALRQKASDDGIPGSNEAFNLPLVNMQESANAMIALSERLKDFAEHLLSKNPEDWAK